MKIRQSPEDFRVEEINEFNISKEKDNFKLYSLEKKNLESFAILRYLSKKNNIPMESFGIAGLKDKHAVTKQYFTIPSQYDIKTLNEKNFNIQFLGFVSKKIKMGDLQGNKFQITVRDIKNGELKGIYEKAKTIEQMGVPNYFDSQRFGSVTKNSFIAKYLIKKDYEKAVKLYLTHYTKYENKDIKKEKKFILAHWNNLSNLNIKNQFLSRIVDKYKTTKSWLEAYKEIPHYLREIYKSAYQSYLWNECVKKVLRKAINDKYLYTIEYNIGLLLYYKKITEDEAKKIPQTFKTISAEMKPTELEKEIIDKTLSREGIALESFDIKKEAEVFFKTSERAIIIKPKDFAISNYSVDELNDKGKKNRFKVVLTFSLQKGSYATVITKRIFNQ